MLSVISNMITGRYARSVIAARFGETDHLRRGTSVGVGREGTRVTLRLEGTKLTLGLSGDLGRNNNGHRDGDGDSNAVFRLRSMGLRDRSERGGGVGQGRAGGGGICRCVEAMGSELDPSQLQALRDRCE